jgi:uncharacterized membrane protein
MLAQQMVNLVIPLTIVVLAIPLILQKVPRNGFYGFRTPLTMSSDEIWYYANKVSGIALVAAGVFWFALGRVLPAVDHNERHAYQMVTWLGAGSLVVGFAVSYWLTRRKFGK